MDNYYYELKYKNNNNEVSYKFGADIDCYKIQEHLENFLLSCSWDKSNIEEIFNRQPYRE